MWEIERFIEKERAYESDIKAHFIDLCDREFIYLQAKIWYKFRNIMWKI